jgi:hypothetical protein
MGYLQQQKFALDANHLRNPTFNKEGRKMNTFRNALTEQVLDRDIARTENGMRAFKSTLNANVDLFGSIGRGKNLNKQFEAALKENEDVALRIAQYARDIRGGQGERKLFRDFLLYLEQTNQELLINSHLLDNIPTIGRFDDLLIFNTQAVRERAFAVFTAHLLEGNKLAAKWAPRQGATAVALRNFLGLSPKRYRKLLVGNTEVVESLMCSREWNAINFSHVPSVAMSRYMTAFHRNAPEAFTAYREALKRDDGTAKVNAGALYPYDLVAKLGGATQGTMEGFNNSFYGRYNRTYAEDIVIQRQWEALPDYMNDAAVLPVVDVSGSMGSPVAGKTNTSALDVAVSLGLYCAERSKNEAFRNLLVTFSEKPSFFEVSGTLAERLGQMANMDWGNNTNLHAVFELVLSKALQNNVSDAEMPKIVLIFSDMQFDYCASHDDSAMQMIRRKYERAGYTMPNIVFWNLRDAENKPVRFNERGAALVGGFSPATMKAVLSADLDKFSPLSVMLQAVMVDRYSW